MFQLSFSCFGLFFLILLPELKCNKIHEHFTRTEIREVFGTNPNSVPDYEVVNIWHALDKRGAGEVILKSYGRTVKLYLQPLDGVLFTDDTLVWLARGKNNQVTYTKVPSTVFKNAFKYLHDPNSRASFTTYEDNDGLSFLGTIEGREVRSLPDRFDKNLIRKKRDLFPNFDLPDFADPTKEYKSTLPHLIIRIPKPSTNGATLSHPNNDNAIRQIVERSNHDAPKIVFPEMFVAMDYAINVKSPNDPKFFKYLLYTMALFTAIDLRFRELSYPEVRLQVVGIILGTNRGAIPWMSPYNKDGKFDLNVYFEQSNVISSKKQWLIPRDRFDFLITATNREICFDVNNCDSTALGIYGGFRDGKCADISAPYLLSAAFYDPGHFGGLSFGLQFIAKIFGADMDGEGDASFCYNEDGYIMSTSQEHPENRLTWSDCSIEMMTNTLWYTLKCMRNHQRKPQNGTRLQPILPGELTSLNEMCRARGWEYSCPRYQKECCRSLYCYNSGFFSGFPTLWECRPTERAPEGSPCGIGKICLNRECISNL